MKLAACFLQAGWLTPRQPEGSQRLPLFILQPEKDSLATSLIFLDKYISFILVEMIPGSVIQSLIIFSFSMVTSGWLRQ